MSKGTCHNSPPLTIRDNLLVVEGNSLGGHSKLVDTEPYDDIDHDRESGEPTRENLFENVWHVLLLLPSVDPPSVLSCFPFEIPLERGNESISSYRIINWRIIQFAE